MDYEFNDDDTFIVHPSKWSEKSINSENLFYKDAEDKWHVFST